MLTTTLDGLWVLQILSGIETLAPELGLRPILPRVETKELALDQPVAAELRAAGAIDESGEVDAAILEWMTVLTRRDVSLQMYISTPAREGQVGVLLARFAQWWVVMERTHDIVRIGPAGTATAEGAANGVIRSQIERLCGHLEPARLRPATIDADNIIEHVKSHEGLRKFLDDQRLGPEQIRALMLATDTTKSASASIVAVQSGAEGAPGRIYVEHGSVTIYDTPEGRIVAEHALRARKKWMIVSPGTPANITSAINAMLRRLPAKEEWFSYRRIV